MARKKQCKFCKKPTDKELGVTINMSFFCNTKCAAQHGIKLSLASKKRQLAKKEKAEKRKNATRKKDFYMKDIKTRKEAAKRACHAYIRERDKGMPCICCGREIVGAVHAGHFLESGNNPMIRYDEDNIHAQSGYCNTYKGGDSDDYQGRLRVKIGDERVDALLSKRGGTLKRTAQDYIDIENHYKEKLKILLCSNEYR